MPVMKRKNNLLDNCGREWFQRRVVGGHFVHDGKVMCLTGVMDAGNLIARDILGNKDVLINKEVIHGFGVFAYPELGYRRINNLAAWISKTHSYERGLREKYINHELSETSRVFYRHTGEDLKRKELLAKVMIPDYDTPEHIIKVMEGKQLTAVLSHNLLVEPSHIAADDHYNVLFRRRAVGRIMPDGKAHFYKPEYDKYIRPMLGNEGVIK